MLKPCDVVVLIKKYKERPDSAENAKSRMKSRDLVAVACTYHRHAFVDVSACPERVQGSAITTSRAYHSPQFMRLNTFFA